MMNDQYYPHTFTPLGLPGTEATPSQYVVMPAERPLGIAPLYVPEHPRASEKCLFPSRQWKSRRCGCSKTAHSKNSRHL